MKFTLKDYQDEAVNDVLDRLRKARRRWHEESEKNAFSLTAATGAGKTVMAAAVFEALFHGNGDYDFEADPGAVVVWFSDDPSLNEQSRWRLQEASDRLTISDLVSVGNSFAREKFEPGKVYFLNTQKLSKSSLLVRGHDSDDGAVEITDGQKIMPDMRSHTIWDTIQNTIEDPELTLYLVLDEAHRGMRDQVNGTKTIVQTLINGSGAVPGIPVVLGISATVERFNDAVRGMAGHTSLPNVLVDAKKVQDSGLLKDTINLDIPDEVGDFTTVLLRRGAQKLKEISNAWAEYSEVQDDVPIVRPLMVLQVPNTPDHNEIGRWLDVIFDTWPELPMDCVANVFGEHKHETFAGHTVRYIQPERVQESDWVRILVAKDAISTGWDCPRAEVMVSFRRATDKTHITQLLGRMVRTPLARRIPGIERLNSVDCLLPHFNKASVEEVVQALRGEGGDGMPGRRVLINPCEAKPNPSIPEEVWKKFRSLPSQTLPKRQSRPVKRLTALAHELAVDGLLACAGAKAHQEMHRVLDKACAHYKADIKDAREAVLTVEGKTIQADVEGQSMTFNDFVERADYAVIEDAYKRAARIFSPDLTKSYAEHLAAAADEDDDPEEALIEAHTIIAAMGLVPKIGEGLEKAAESLANEWLQEHRVSIRELSDERQDAYRQIQELSAEPQDIDLTMPRMWLQPTTAVEIDGTEIPLAAYEHHLLCDEDGLFPETLNTWEKDVLTAESAREETIAWYRNPSRATQESLGVTYEEGGEFKILRPDFIFFSQEPDGTISANIVDPHGTHLADSLPKLKGLSRYVEANEDVFRRVEAVAQVDGQYRALDLTDPDVRAAIQSGTTALGLYKGANASDYPVA